MSTGLEQKETKATKGDDLADRLPCLAAMLRPAIALRGLGSLLLKAGFGEERVHGVGLGLEQKGTKDTKRVVNVDCAETTGPGNGQCYFCASSQEEDSSWDGVTAMVID